MSSKQIQKGPRVEVCLGEV